MNISPMRVWYVLESKMIAKYPCYPPSYVVSIEAAFSAANLWVILIFSYVDSPSCLENVEFGKLSMYCFIVRFTIFIVFEEVIGCMKKGDEY